MGPTPGPVLPPGSAHKEVSRHQPRVGAAVTVDGPAPRRGVRMRPCAVGAGHPQALPLQVSRSGNLRFSEASWRPAVQAWSWRLQVARGLAQHMDRGAGGGRGWHPAFLDDAGRGVYSSGLPAAAHRPLRGNLVERSPRQASRGRPCPLPWAFVPPPSPFLGKQVSGGPAPCTVGLGRALP